LLLIARLGEPVADIAVDLVVIASSASPVVIIVTWR
jgi:hypothetical protein